MQHVLILKARYTQQLSAVPDVPEINLLPVYSSGNNTLIKVIVVFTQGLTVSA